MLISNHTRVTRASEQRLFGEWMLVLISYYPAKNIALVILSKFAYYKEFPSKVYDF